MKLSKTQERALNKLTFTNWDNAYRLQESLSTLNALTRKKLVERKSEFGASFCPRIMIYFRKRKGDNYVC